jgi:hypothetical protein
VASLGVQLKGNRNKKRRVVHDLKGRRLEAVLSLVPIREEGEELEQNQLIIQTITCHDASYGRFNDWLKPLDPHRPRWKRVRNYTMSAYSPRIEGFPTYILSDWHLSDEEYTYLRRIHRTHALSLVLKLK